jgi:hypothetical protein
LCRLIRQRDNRHRAGLLTPPNLEKPQSVDGLAAETMSGRLHLNAV